MGRIRTIKPEFWTSEQIVECSPNARLLFIGMWNFCDDGGNHPASIKSLKMQVFPGDDFSTDQIQGWVEEIIKNRLLVTYEGSDGKQYWHVTGWHHQKIDRPSFKYPKFDEHSTNDRRTPPPGKDSKGKDSKGGDGEKSAHAHAQAVEVEVLQPLPSPAMHEFVNAQTPDELESKISKFYTAWPNLKEWIESTTVAGQMGPQDRTDVVRGFCSYAIEKNYGAKTYRELHARFSKWWNDQKNFNRASANGKPANGKQNGLKFNSPDTISDAFEFAARWQRENELGLPH